MSTWQYRWRDWGREKKISDRGTFLGGQAVRALRDRQCIHGRKEEEGTSLVISGVNRKSVERNGNMFLGLVAGKLRKFLKRREITSYVQNICPSLLVY